MSIVAKPRKKLWVCAWLSSMILPQITGLVIVSGDPPWASPPKLHAWWLSLTKYLCWCGTLYLLHSGCFSYSLVYLLSFWLLYLMWTSREFYYNDHINVDLQPSNILPLYVWKQRRYWLWWAAEWSKEDYQFDLHHRISGVQIGINYEVMLKSDSSACICMYKQQRLHWWWVQFDFSRFSVICVS